MHRTEGANFTRDSNGRNQFKDGPPGTVVNAAFMNTIQEEVSHVIEQAGLQLRSAGNDTRDQLYDAMLRLLGAGFDAVITNQIQFDNIIERTGANQYQFKDQYKSVYFKNVTGGYQMSGSTSPLTGGDTYGVLNTNNVDLVFAENTESYIDFANTPGYINVNTTYCNLWNIDVRGTGTVASAIAQSFLISAEYVTLQNCKTSNRLSNAAFAGFRAAAVVAQYTTAKLTNCTAHTLTSSAQCDGFNLVFNASSCLSYNITSSAGVAYGFISLYRSTNCFAWDIRGATASYGYSTCGRLNCCMADWIVATAGNAYGFSNCDEMASCKAEDIDGRIVYGFINCDNISACKAQELDSTLTTAFGYSSCNNVSACTVEDVTGNTDTYGFYTCTNLSSCLAKDIDSATAAASGFYIVEGITGCRAQGIAGTTIGRGFYDCEGISACVATTITTAGGGDALGFVSCDGITGCYAHTINNSGGVDGFNACHSMSGCRAETLDSSSDVCRGFTGCSKMSGCSAEDIDVTGAFDAYGFNNCDYLSACHATDIDSSAANAYGFNGCEFGSSLWTDEASNPNCDYIDTTDANIVNQFSSHPTNWT
jgi:uncharacterized protein YunC (DUF1805 family)